MSNFNINILKKRLWRILFYLLLYSSIGIILIPVLIMFLGSLMTDHEIALNIYPNFHIFPNEWGSLNELFTNYIWLIETSGRAISAVINSFKISITVTILVVIFSSMLAYPLARMNLRMRKTILLVILFSSMLPFMAILIPLYLQAVKMGLYDTLFVIIITNVAFLLPLGTWLMKSFFDNIPSSIEDAAMVDGCSRYRTFLSIIIPLALPGVGAVAVIAFIGSWGSFFVNLILTQSKAQVFTLYIALFASAENVEFGRILMLGTINCIPVVVIALIFQKIILGGLMEGSVKG